MNVVTGWFARLRWGRPSLAGAVRAGRPADPVVSSRRRHLRTWTLRAPTTCGGSPSRWPSERAAPPAARAGVGPIQRSGPRPAGVGPPTGASSTTHRPSRHPTPTPPRRRHRRRARHHGRPAQPDPPGAVASDAFVAEETAGVSLRRGRRPPDRRRRGRDVRDHGRPVRPDRPDRRHPPLIRRTDPPT